MNERGNKKPSFRGKTIGGFTYAHKSGLPFLSKDFSKILEKSLPLLSEFTKWNVVKFNLKKTENISFLKYEDFETVDFPSLLDSCQVNIRNQTIKIRKHSINNPPVLHRKELLISPNHHDLIKFQRLTLQLEAMGAFKNIIKLGTKLRWQDELDRLNIVVEDHIATKSMNQKHVS